LSVFMSAIAPILKAIRTVLSNNTTDNINAIATLAGLKLEDFAVEKPVYDSVTNNDLKEIIAAIRKIMANNTPENARALAQAAGLSIEKPTPKEFLEGEAVASIKSGQIKPNAEGKIINGAMDWVRDYLAKNRPSQIFFNPLVGEIILSPRSIKSAMNHKPLPIDVQAIPAIPDALEKAIVLDKSVDDGGKDIDNIVIAAPVEIDGERYYLVMRLRRDTRSDQSQPRFYTVAAVLEKEAIKKAASLMTRALSPEDDSGLTGGRSRLLNVLHKALSVNDSANQDFALSTYTEAELRAQEAALKAAEAKRQAEEKAAKDKAFADRQVGDFRLSGSSMPSDVAASYGQNDMFVQTREAALHSPLL
jgi:Large polyvalent protein-associated domain 3